MVKKYPLIQDTEMRKEFMFGEEIEIEKSKNRTRMEWFSRDKIWVRASEEQISCAKNYLDTNQQEQMIGVFKDVRYKEDTIYTVYMVGETIFELLYDTPLHVAYINRLI